MFLNIYVLIVLKRRDMRSKVIVLCALLSGSFLLKAQTGPGGIGTTSSCSTLKLWLDANTGVTTSSSSVTLWSDRSATCADNATPPAATNRPQLVSSAINGFPTVRFDGTDDYFDISNESNLDMTQWSIYLVGKVTSNKDYNYWFGKGNDGQENFEFLCYAAPYIHTPIYYTDASRDFLNSANPTNAVNSYNIWQYDKTSGGGRAIYQDGTSLITDATTKTPQTNNLTAYLGTERGTTGRYFNGDISEVIVFSTKNNEVKRVIIENYLSAKYNIALGTSSDDKYAGDNSGNGDYDFGVAGIGQDASGNQNIVYSTSIAGGMGLTYSSGFGNGDYVLSGYALPYNFEDVVDVGGISGGGTPARWARDFYIDVTNTGANITADFLFDLSDGGVGTATAGAQNKYVLLYRAGTSGNWTELVVGASSVSGDQILFGGVTVTNDGYYTIGTQNRNSATLPIELMSFTAQSEKNTKVKLNWSTASEKDNHHFSVERSSDGISFTELEKVPTKAPNGNSLVKLDYQTFDDSPLAGTSFYRLKQTDNNGAYKNYNIVTVSMVKDKNVVFTVYPNPGQGQFSVDFSGLENNHDIDVFLHDVQGKEVYHGVYSTQNESGTFSIIPQEKIAAGTYFASFYLEGVKYQVKVLVK